MAQNEKEQNDYRITYYNAVSSKEVDWLWYPYIPYGKITILQGDPGEGKSTMMMQLAALITTGKAMPDGSGDKIPGNVIYQAAEDGIEDTIKPRLEAAGADCSRIAFLEQLDEEPILLNDTRLAQAIEGTQAKLLVIDPLQAYLRMDSEIQRTNSVRSVLTNLAKVAERTGCAVVLIGHMNKSNRTKGIYRGLGSIDIAAVARSILLVGKLANLKNVFNALAALFILNRYLCKIVCSNKIMKEPEIKSNLFTMVGWDICILEGNGFVRRLSTNGNMSVLVES